MAAFEDLFAARRDALARGDKALGREIYHQLQNLGFSPEHIDADAARTDVPVPHVEVGPAPETADAEPLPEKAVPRRAKKG